MSDATLLAARGQARSALEEITGAETIGAEAGFEEHEEHVVTLFFESLVKGYPGWRWAATVARVDEQSPVNVLEVGMLPGTGSVVAPEWVPWSERLAQYREAQAKQAAEEAAAAEAAAEELAADGDDELEDELLDNDFSDFDDEIDGVDLEGEEPDEDEAEDEDDSVDEDDETSDHDEASDGDAVRR